MLHLILQYSETLPETKEGLLVLMIFGMALPFIISSVAWYLYENS